MEIFHTLWPTQYLMRIKYESNMRHAEKMLPIYNIHIILKKIIFKENVSFDPPSHLSILHRLTGFAIELEKLSAHIIKLLLLYMYKLEIA